MPSDHIPRDKRLKENSTKLRNGATREENHLWYDFLRKYDVNFNRQRIIGEYIADFYCARAALVIELDGSQHYEDDAAKSDAKRDSYMENLGIKVLRFTNRDIHTNFEGVCVMIDKEVQKRLGR